MNEVEHRRLRELLGSYALGHLPPVENDRVRAHLDGCSDCRADLSDIAALVPLLDRVDPLSFESPPVPPADLGARIRAAVASEPRRPVLTGPATTGPGRRAWTTGRRRPWSLAVAAALVVAVGLGAAVGRSTAPDPSAAPAPALEAVTLTATQGSGVTVDSAGLVSHTWGVELRLEAEGFADGEVFEAAVRDASGRFTPAGRFVGTGSATMTCNLQAGVLRDDASAIVVRDEEGRPVLRSAL